MVGLYYNYRTTVAYYKRYGASRLIPFIVEFIPRLVNYFVKIGIINWIVEERVIDHYKIHRNIV